MVREICVKYPGGPTRIRATDMAHVRVVRIRKTSNAEMKRKTSSTKLLDKTIWNPRPVIDSLSRAITESGGSYLLVLGPAFSELLTNNELLTNAVGMYETFPTYSSTQLPRYCPRSMVYCIVLIQ